MNAKELLTLITTSQDGKPERSMRDAMDFVVENKAPVSTYLNRLLCAAVHQHEGHVEAREAIAADLWYSVAQLGKAITALGVPTVKALEEVLANSGS